MMVINGVCGLFFFGEFPSEFGILAMSKIVSTSVFVFALLLISGCGDGGPKIVTVSGQATYKQKPIPRLMLTFSPANGRPSTGMTDADGKFELDYLGERKGAQVGTHTVTFEYRPKDPGEEMDILEGKKKRPPEIEAIIKKYIDGKVPLSVEIKEPTKTFELKLD